jgi:hypothetical protein
LGRIRLTIFASACGFKLLYQISTGGRVFFLYGGLHLYRALTLG